MTFTRVNRITARLLRELSGGCDFEFEVESGKLVSRMIVRVRQLRQQIKLLRLGRRSLIDPWKQIDQVQTWSSRSREVDHDVALAVEPTGVSHIGVVICGGENVVVF